MSRGRLWLAAGVGGLAVAGVTAAALAARSRSGQPAPVLPDVTPDTPGHRGGSGTPLLLIHGGSVTWRTWKPVLPLLERHHDVIAPTLLGHSGGPTMIDNVLTSPELLIDGLERELDRLGLDTVHVAGNSLGGWLSLELARRGRARSVVVFSPGGAWRSKLRYSALATSMIAGISLMEAFGDRAERLALTPRGRRLLASAQFEHPERADPAELIADIRALRATPIMRPLMKALGSHPMEPLPNPGCPVRVVWARRDRVIPFKHFGEPMMDLVPSAELIMLDGVGHVPMVDDPEAVSRLILEITGRVDRENQDAPALSRRTRQTD